MGLELAEPGYSTACYVETEPYAQASLIAGMLGGVLPGSAEHGPRSSGASSERAPSDHGGPGFRRPAPVWGNPRTFCGYEWRDHIDTILAGYPCQPFSAAGKRKGEDDPRHLWPDIERIIGEIQPRWVFLENVAGHITLGLETVLRRLRNMGFTVAAGLFSAEEAGAPHERQRVFIVAHRRHPKRREKDAAGNIANWNDTRRTKGDGWARERRADVDHAAGARCDGAGIGTGANVEGGECLSGTGCPELAHADGGHPGAERQQCGGQQRLYPAGGGTGQRNVGNPARIGRGEGRAKHELRGGRDAVASAGGKMADASQPGSQGREQRGASGERDRAEAHGPTSELRRPLLFPPGPGDMDGWRHVLALDPTLAPAVSLGDLSTFARYFAALVEAGELSEAEAKLRLCRVADGLDSRTRALRLLGNGVHPLAAAYAWRSLSYAHGLGRVDMGAAR